MLLATALILAGCGETIPQAFTTPGWTLGVECINGRLIRTATNNDTGEVKRQPAFDSMGQPIPC
jgi:hypothetical protein